MSNGLCNYSSILRGMLISQYCVSIRAYVFMIQEKYKISKIFEFAMFLEHFPSITYHRNNKCFVTAITVDQKMLQKYNKIKYFPKFLFFLYHKHIGPYAHTILSSQLDSKYAGIITQAVTHQKCLKNRMLMFCGAW